ncbi:MAG: NUDIX domain-containing protein [Candidatus Woesebacteria bacterium]|nr:NUDIX domain-containing protein [Candidatus Woesebacteria bacterium]
MSNERFTLRAAVYLILLNEDKILLSRRYNTGWMDGRYSLIAGHIDGNESVDKAMIREAWEEAGIKIVKKDLKPATVLHRKSSDQEYMDFFFVTKQWSGKPIIKEPNKCDDMDWFPLNDLPKNLLPHILEAIKNYQNKIPFSESGWD